MYRRMVVWLAIVTTFVAGCSSEEPAQPEEITSSEANPALYQERCVGNDDKVLYDSSVSTMGYAGLTPAELAAEITKSTTESAAEWYSTTNMRLTEEGLNTLRSSVDVVIMENPNKSAYDFTMRGEPNDADTHAWCLGLNN